MLDWLYSTVAALWNMVQWLYVYISQLAQFIWNNLVVLANWVGQFAQWALDVFKLVGQAIVSAARTVWKGLSALGHLDFRKIWTAMKRGYERFRRALHWYMRHIQEPLDKMRARIMDVYRRFFKPIVRFLESLRVFTRLLAIFNRKLAARLDARLWDLESKVMWPITAALKRLNSLSSYQRAWITRLGLLDRTLLLASLRRDALLVWEVLTNPRARIFAPSPPLRRPLLKETVHDFRLWAEHDAGPFVERERRWVEQFEALSAELE